MGRAEGPIEEYLRQRVKKLGGFHRKVTYQGRTGSPDDWCFFPGGRLIIIECKAAGEKPTAVQAVEILKLKAFGFGAFVADSREMVDDILDAVLGDDVPYA